MAADDKQIILDTKVLSLGKNELIEFALSLKIDKSKVEGKSKVQIIKEIRNALEVNLSTFTEEDDKVNYLDGLISALNPETSETGAKISEEQTEIQNLEKELSELEIKRKAIEDKLSHTKKSKIPENESGSTTKISAESAKSPLFGLSSTILHRDFKIQGIIGQPSQKDKLGYQALMSQIETGKDKGYSDKEIMTAVIRAVQPGMQLRSYLESVSGLTLPKLRKILRFHFHEKNATELYQALTNMTQQPNEDPQAFLMRALTIRQKIIYASKESDSAIKYDGASVQSLFLHALETGLKDETIRAKIRPLTDNANVSDEQLIEAVFMAVSAETERSNKFSQSLNKVRDTKARVSALHNDESVGEKREVLAAIKQVRTELSAVQSEVKTLRETVSQQNSKEQPEGESRNVAPTKRSKCDKCKTSGEECNHCFHCGGLNHIARYCRSRSRNPSGNGQRLPPRDRE